MSGAFACSICRKRAPIVKRISIYMYCDGCKHRAPTESVKEYFYQRSNGSRIADVGIRVGRGDNNRVIYRKAYK